MGKINRGFNGFNKTIGICLFLLIIFCKGFFASSNITTRSLLTTEIGNSIDLICGKNNPSLKTCHVISPQNKRYVLFEGAQYEGGKIQALMKPDMCGVSVNTVDEKDDGVWQCNVFEQKESGMDAKLITSQINVTIQPHQPTTRQPLVETITKPFEELNDPSKTNVVYLLHIAIPISIVVIISIVSFCAYRKISNAKNIGNKIHPENNAVNRNEDVDVENILLDSTESEKTKEVDENVEKPETVLSTEIDQLDYTDSFSHM